MIRLDLLNVGMVEETGGILLVLRAPEVERLLVIETGLLEGQAVAMEAQGVRAERPLTQDLLYNVILSLGARVSEVRIREFHDEAFHSELVLSRPDGGPDVSIDARPSDAIALALRAEAPIYIDDKLIAEMGIPEDREAGRFAELYDDDDEDDEPAGRVIH